MITWNAILTLTDVENSLLQTIVNLNHYDSDINVCYKYWKNSLTQIKMRITEQ